MTWVLVIFVGLVIAFFIFTDWRKRTLGVSLIKDVNLLKIGLAQHIYLNANYNQTMSVEEAKLFTGGIVNFLFDENQSVNLDLIKVKNEAYLFLENNDQIRELIIMGIRVLIVAKFMYTGKPGFPIRSEEILSKYGGLYPEVPNPALFKEKVEAFLKSVQSNSNDAIQN